MCGVRTWERMSGAAGRSSPQSDHGGTSPHRTPRCGLDNESTGRPGACERAISPTYPLGGARRSVAALFWFHFRVCRMPGGQYCLWCFPPSLGLLRAFTEHRAAEIRRNVPRRWNRTSLWHAVSVQQFTCRTSPEGYMPWYDIRSTTEPIAPSCEGHGLRLPRLR